MSPSACIAALTAGRAATRSWNACRCASFDRCFGELRRDIRGISPKMLTARLRELEEKCVVIRTVAPSSPPSVEYTLSELGKELIPVIDTIVRVGSRLLHEAKSTVRPGTVRRRA